MRVRPCVLLPNDNKLLLLRYRYGQEDVFGIPGGSPDPAETLEEAVLREVVEELSISAQIERLLFIGEILYPEPKESVLNCIFLGKPLSTTPCVNPKHSTAKGYLWAPIEALPKMNLYPNVGEQITEAWNKKFDIPLTNIKKIPQKWF